MFRFVMLSDSGGGAKHPTELSHTALWAGFLQNSFRFVLPSTVLGCFASLNMTTEQGHINSGTALDLKLNRSPYLVWRQTNPSPNRGRVSAPATNAFHSTPSNPLPPQTLTVHAVLIHFAVAGIFLKIYT